MDNDLIQFLKTLKTVCAHSKRMPYFLHYVQELTATERRQKAYHSKGLTC